MGNEGPFTKDQVIEASTAYFNGEKLPATIFADKYALRDKEGRYWELTPDDMHRRLAQEFARIEAKYLNPLSEEEIYRYFARFSKICPQGSPMFAVGNDYQLASTSNCAVVTSPTDTMSSILNTGRDMGNLFKRRFGAGLSLSNLRPEGAPVNNAANTSTGAWSFADFYSYVTRMVGQCIAKDQRVLTRRGLVAIQDVTAREDEVWTRIGWVPVQHVYRNGTKPVYRMTTDYGYDVVATEDHIFSSETGEKRMKDIGVGGAVNLLVGEAGWERPLVRLTPVAYERRGDNNSNRLKDIAQPAELTTDLAYLLGYAYGDGYVEADRYGDACTLSLAVAHAYPEIEERLVATVRTVFAVSASVKPGDGALNRVELRSKHALAFLAANGLLKEKADAIVYPQAIKESPLAVQMAFIAGFFDADGYASGSKKGFTFASVNRAFLREIQTVLGAAGVVTRLHTEDRGDQGWRTLYTLTVTGRVSKTRFKALMEAWSVKAFGARDLGKRDENLSPWTARDLGVKYNDFAYVPDNSQYLSLNVLDRLAGEDPSVATLAPPGKLVRARVTAIEYAGESETFDLGLAEEHLFWCEGVYVHNSGRRGATMIVMDVRHPDIEKFITMKADLTKVTGANVSVQVSDDFMCAVENDEEFTLRWPVDAPTFPEWRDDPIYAFTKIEPAKVERVVKARAIFDLIAEQASKTAEPGILFWDTIQRNLPLDFYRADGFETISTNPCAELPLCGEDSCRLISIYLPAFVRNPLTPDASFDWEDFQETVRVAQRLSDDLVDLELEKLHAIREAADTEDERALFTRFIEKCEKGRRTGLGTHGLGDALTLLTVKYDTEEGVATAAKIYETLKLSAYTSSIDMAEERGAFPIFDWETEKDCAFFRRMPKSLLDRMRMVGRRNGALLTNAPTGSVSIMSMLHGRWPNGSSGIEPVFSLKEYTRNRKIDPSKESTEGAVQDATGDWWKASVVQHPTVKLWREMYGDAPLPDYFVDAGEIDWQKRVEMQGTITNHIDHSVSSTLNLPKGTGPGVVAEIYLEAWKRRCKGVTVYVDGSRDQQVLSANTERAKTAEPDSVFTLCAKALREPALLERVIGLQMTDAERQIAERVLFPAMNVTNDFTGEPKTILDIPEKVHAANLRAQDAEAKFERLLERFKKVERESVGECLRPTHRPVATEGEMFKATFTDPIALDDRKVYVFVGKNAEGQPVEAFVIDQQGDADLRPYAEALGRLTSLALKFGIPAAEVIGQLKGLSGGAVSYTKGIHLSVPDLVAKRLEIAGAPEKASEPSAPQYELTTGLVPPHVQWTPVGGPVSTTPTTVVRGVGANWLVVPPEAPLGSQAGSLAVCPRCKKQTLKVEGGCNQCLNEECGFSKC